jgi:hypothetical protein
MTSGTWTTLALTLATAGCAESGQLGSTGGYEYRIPSGWTQTDRSNRRGAITEWTPAENPRKESVTIVVAPAPPSAPPSHSVRLLGQALNGLPGGRFSAPVQVTTKSGRIAFRSDGTFIPAGANGTYRRVHAIFVDSNETLVHVLYTAASPDEALDAFTTVLDSATRKEG